MYFSISISPTARTYTGLNSQSPLALPEGGEAAAGLTGGRGRLLPVEGFNPARQVQWMTPSCRLRACRRIIFSTSGRIAKVLKTRQPADKETSINQGRRLTSGDGCISDVFLIQEKATPEIDHLATRSSTAISQGIVTVVCPSARGARRTRRGP